MNDSTLIVTYSTYPSSFDPLDFDAINNFNFGRMLYATPLEFNVAGELVSSLLEDFSYHYEDQRIEFVLKENLKFEDGSLMTSEDLALAVARMALARPKFPVISEIVGLAEWLTQKNPLLSFPKGMSVSKNRVEISLKRKVNKPLFRFTLELFSVVPAHCIDRVLNKLNCTHPPESGYYKLERENAELGAEQAFRRRRAFAGQSFPETITIKYLPFGIAMQNLDAQKLQNIVVASTGESILDTHSFEYQKKFEFVETPRAWHLLLKLNSKSAIFHSTQIRMSFVNHLRTRFSEGLPLSFAMNESFFSSLVSGYVEFTKERPPVDTQQLIKALSGRQLTWISRQETSSYIDEIIDSICREFKIKCKRLVRGTQATSEAIRSGSYDIFVGTTGFWSMDPFGDAQMLFTPEMHSVLSDMWHDAKIQRPLALLVNDEHSDKIVDKVDSPAILQESSPANIAKQLNMYIHSTYKYNVLAHYSFQFFSSRVGFSSLKLPVSGTIPYPWQLFGAESSVLGLK